jgi:hypothetical protein
MNADSPARPVGGDPTVAWLVLAALLLGLVVSAWSALLNPVLEAHEVALLGSTLERSQGVMAGPSLPPPVLDITTAWLHSAAGWSMESTAKAITGTLYAWFCAVFLVTVARWGADRRTLLFAAALVLLHPALTQQRGTISAEPGLWACLLLSLSCLWRYLCRPGWPAALHWLALVAVASLFSRAALLIAASTPLVMAALVPRRQRLATATRFALLAWPPLLLLGATGDLFLLVGMSPSAGGILDAVPASANYPGAGYWAGAGAALSLAAGQGLSSLGLPCLALLAWLFWRRRGIPAVASLLLAYLVVATTWLAWTAYREPGALAAHAPLAVILVLPFLADALADLSRSQRFTGPALCAGLLAVLAAGSLYSDGYRQDHRNEAAGWLLTNTAPVDPLLTNDHHLAWRLRERADWRRSILLEAGDILAQERWRRFRFTALSLPGDGIATLDPVAARPALEVRQSFVNDDGDLVVILENRGYGSAAKPPSP